MEASGPANPPPMDPQLKVVVDDIRKYGCHILHVVEEDGQPPYSYTIGLNRTRSAPDAAVIGLKKDTAHALLNGYRNQLVLGRRYRNGDRAEGYIDGTAVEFRTIHPGHLPTWFGWNTALYRRDWFPMLQLLYPGSDGSWPWEPQASAFLRRWQPMLDRAPPSAAG
ncbi:DUF4262 domain-containing protein [Arenimonas composti]|uniref:DUF4262 domain-containing protein n=1 Tax=Arenimonas composti TR7-09 = DSM 18010 TaxID=1121013 RepID=A0A091BDU4_9GAMM|nr:DUF4262 domain-containing protein [Arenimonas composti]KFN49712.1 hypothetical protein P873_09145 [Arenimonas composti TR7-09 = DSM 18010]